MKRIVVSTAAALALSALAAAPASAATTSGATGTVNLSGTVAPSCQALGGGNAATFGAAFDLGEMSQAGGTIRNGLSFSTSGAGNGNFQIVCSGVSPTIKLDATSLTTGGGSAPNGYAAVVTYNATVSVATISAANQLATKSAHLTSGASTQTVPMSSLYLANQANNVVVTADTFATAHSTDILVAGTYAGAITVTVTP
ncbi:hypothetical protein ACO2Q3_19355 [Caulobacter sp. KR2-114]|uniref:hypothetical protein n=1 Tax=Caulobacter sp. KR2-114 TaxID=3400912 RepID=UPI003C10413B